MAMATDPLIAPCAPDQCVSQPDRHELRVLGYMAAQVDVIDAALARLPRNDRLGIDNIAVDAMRATVKAWRDAILARSIA